MNQPSKPTGEQADALLAELNHPLLDCDDKSRLLALMAPNTADAWDDALAATKALIAKREQATSV
ncbi:hypothetical protein F0P96_10415 [Hymenobacter busanensis]|uniref:Uncharacterized protein n=1 Tax=Hymenobacter busanensis TaxID=2607656 RepID=A0A7L4ZXI4_9BACT|nr:hypothetical protein [Hymenobacter busanensis]KAA9333373.1 hypothetical protein F0P96_10415 [Hymenobacter busanensis]QHJ07948.1 hypothetical protein GUY19_11895 [Hymenobacter busanensis]